MGENGELGAHRAGWAGVSGSGRRQSGGCVLQTRVKKQARGRPGLPEEGRALEGAGRVRNTGDYCGRLPSQQTHTHCACSPGQAPAWALGTQETQSAARRCLRHTSSPVSPSSWTPAMAPHSSAKTSIAPVARESPAPLSGLTASLPPCLIFLLWQHQSHFSSQAAPPATPGPLHVPFLLLVVSSCSPPTSAPSLFVFPDRI